MMQLPTRRSGVAAVAARQYVHHNPPLLSHSPASLTRRRKRKTRNNPFHPCRIAAILLLGVLAYSVWMMTVIHYNNQINHTTRLRDLNIVLIGDSLTRYQYLSLAWKARYGQWYDEMPSIFTGRNNDGSSLNIMKHQNFNVPFLPNGTWWMTYYWFTNRLLAPYERCDCFKASTKLSEFCENRYYQDADQNVFLTYIE